MYIQFVIDPKNIQSASYTHIFLPCLVNEDCEYGTCNFKNQLDFKSITNFGHMAGDYHRCMRTCIIMFMVTLLYLLFV